MPNLCRLLRRGRRLARRLARRSGAERRALVVATAAVAVVAVLLRTCPFHWVRAVLGVDRSHGPSGPGLSPAAERRLLWAVAAVSRRLLPARPCLTQALAAQALLRWRGGRAARLQIGVARAPDGRLRAHAWLERDGRVLIGGDASPTAYQLLSEDPRPAPYPE